MTSASARLEARMRAREQAALDEAEAAAEEFFPRRRHDVVMTCPPSLLVELGEQFPELVDEIIDRRPESVVRP
jgi:hypothetical protein